MVLVAPYVGDFTARDELLMLAVSLAFLDFIERRNGALAFRAVAFDFKAVALKLGQAHSQLLLAGEHFVEFVFLREYFFAAHGRGVCNYLSR